MTALVVALVLAHPQGFHKRVTLELWSTSIRGLVVMDIDSGERCQSVDPVEKRFVSYNVLVIQHSRPRKLNLTT